MKALFLLGSPRKNGNSEYLAKIVADNIRQTGGKTECIRLNNLSIKPCQACNGCIKDGNCIIDDDMTPLYNKVDEADRLILVSPVYFYGVSAQLKLFIDRCQARWSRKYILKQRLNKDRKREGHLISVAATRGEKLFEGLLLATRCVFDALDLREGQSLLIRGADEKNSCQQNAADIKSAEAFAKIITTVNLAQT